MPEKTRAARGAPALSLGQRADHRRMPGGPADCLVVFLHRRAQPAGDSRFVSRGNGLENQIHGRTMSRKHLRRKVPGPLELIEEAVHLLRLSPWAVLGGYYLGSLPFVLGLLYFWADMSRGSAAYEHCAPAALAVSLLFLWMKTWQAIFARHLKAQIAGRLAPAMSLSGFFRTAMNQAILQPSGLFVLPLS